MDNKDQLPRNAIEVEWQKEQIELSKKLVLENSFIVSAVHKIAGVDIAYFTKNGTEYGICSIVVIDYTTHEILETVSHLEKIKVPYITGYLAFREISILKNTFILLQQSPDIYMFDGNGYLHPRHMGLASQASFILNKPTIGVAKSYYRIREVDYTEPENKSGAATNIIIDNDVYGCVLRTHENVKPVFLSPGNWIDLKTSIKMTMNLVSKDSRIPIPTREADLETKRQRKKVLETENKG